jgi:transposase
MAAVMIGIDPHKGSHTAVALGTSEQLLGRVRVRACPSQAGQLVAWAQAWPERIWAVEGAGGPGCLLAQQLVAAGERVLDVPPKLAARVRLLEAGDTNKNDPNDALSVAVAALRSRAPRQVRADGFAVVLKVAAERHRDLARARNQAACRLHAVLRAGSRRHPQGDHRRPGGQDPGAGDAGRRPWPRRAGLAAEFLADIRRLDAQLRETNKKLAAAVKASGTTVTKVFGAGPVIAGTIIGDVRHVSRFPSRDHFAAYDGTAPAGVSSGDRKVHRLSLRGNRRLNHAIHMAAITQIRHKHSDGRAYYEKKIAEGKTHTEALRSLKRRISDAIYAALLADARQQLPPHRAREGNRGTTLSPGRLTPRTPALRTSHSRTSHHPTASGRYQEEDDQSQRAEKPRGKRLTTKRSRSARTMAGWQSSAGASDRGDLGAQPTTGSTGPIEFITPKTERSVPAAYQPSPPAPAGESLATN